MKIPLLDLKREYLAFKKEIDEALLNAVNNANYILGPEVTSLEKEIADYLGAKYCLGVASGTDALVVGLRALAIKTTGMEYFSPEDEIITTPFTFTATGGSILRSGATPVFVDIEPESFNLDPREVEKVVNNKTVGIIPVHLYGQSCGMDEIMKIANDHNLFVIEDVAQAIGASYKNKKLGSYGDIGAFSFFPSKNLGAFGDGGMIATSDQELAGLAKMLSKHGGRDKYNVDHLGYNSRLDTLQASILLVKFKYLERFNSLRQQIASFYNENLIGIEWLVTPPEVEQGHIYHQYTIRVNNGKRDQVQQELGKMGIATAIYYPLLLTAMKLYHGRCIVPASLKCAEEACNEVLSLPVEPLLANEELDYIVNSIKNLPVS